MILFSFIQCVFWRVWKLCGFNMYKWVTEKGCREVFIITDTNVWFVNNKLKKQHYKYACDFIFYCLSVYLKTILILILLHINNIRTLSENIKIICMSFRIRYPRKHGCSVPLYSHLFCKEFMLYLCKLYVFTYIDPRH
jgi:hypothetical protein